MLDFSSDASSVLFESPVVKYFVRAESWLGDDLLFSFPPQAIFKADLSEDRGQKIPERLSLTFPRTYEGIDLSPYTDSSPLVANGQQLRVEVGVELAYGIIEWKQRGWYLIYESTIQNDVIEVDAWGMLQWIDEARFITPFQPTGTIATTIRNLVEPALTVVFDSTLVDRSVPTGINYTENRLDALNSVLDAWPAVGAINNDGDYYVSAVTTPTSADLVFSEFDEGTIVKVVGTSTREDVYNAVVARGTDKDGNTVQGNVAYDTSTGHSYGGSFNPLPVPLYFDSPLLTTQAQATLAASTRLANIVQQTNKAYQVSLVPNPSVETGDAVTLITRFGGIFGTVETLQLPLVPGNGTTMDLIVREV